jgi:hypothetical protein
MLKKHKFITKDIIVYVNSRKYVKDVFFKIWYNDPIVPISVNYNNLVFPFELTLPNYEVIKMLKHAGIKSEKFKNFYFNDNTYEIGWEWKSLNTIWDSLSKHPKIKHKIFKIQFLKQKEYEKIKEYMISHLELKGKYYQIKNITQKNSKARL